MPYTRMKSLHIFLLAVTLLLGGTAAQALEAGASAVRMDLPEGTPLGGDAGRLGRPALGTHDPLWVRCLYLNDGEGPVYLLTLDIHHIPRVLRTLIVAKAEGQASRESIFITATLTGNGPGGMESQLPLRWSEGRFQPDLLDYIAELTADAMRTAREGGQRATLGHGTGRQKVLSRNAFVPDGPIDEQIGVIRVDSADGQAIAILSNFAALPRMVPLSQRYSFSADYPGAFYTALEALSDPGCIALFLPGACGGQTPGSPENQAGWAAVESVGRLLAVGTKSVANKMSFKDASLRTFYREVALPPTIETAFASDTTILQALEIDGLMMTFIPGIPGVEIGLEMRRVFRGLGYSNQFTVAASNDFLRNIVPRRNYGSGSPESLRHHYGPAMETWLYDNVRALVDGSEPRVPVTPQAAPGSDDPPTITLSGSGYQRGYQRGLRYAGQINRRYNEKFLGAVQSGAVRPADALWSHWPRMLDPVPMMLPALAASARPALGGVDEDLFAALEGAAQGADLPFDAFWLIQDTHLVGNQEEPLSIQGPRGTQVAVAGEKAGADGTIVGLNFDWPGNEIPVVATIAPEVGHHILQVSFPWQMGALLGVNDVGLTVSVVEFGMPGENSVSTSPIALLVHKVLKTEDTYFGALELLRSARATGSAKLLVSGATEEGWQTAIVTVGERFSVRTMGEDLLFGIDLARGVIDEETRERYRHVEDALSPERIVGVGELEGVLGAGIPDSSGQGVVWNADTLFSAVIRPGKREIRVALPSESGRVGPFVSYTLRGAAL
jgi:hypothetical protein